MVALFIVLMIATFLVIDVVLHLRNQPALAEQARNRVAAAAETPRVAGFRIAPDAAYHPGHTWARHTAQGVAQVGLDDFASRLVGKPDRVELPAVGTQVRAGRPMATLQRKGRRIPVVAPVSGIVAAVNRQAQATPEELTADPYGKGWLVEIKSSELSYDFRALMSGEMARRFVDEAAAALHSYFAPPEMAMAAADGGEPIDGIADQMDDPTWDRVRSRFLLTDAE
jgi:glycine cleavage system H protein